MPALILDSIVVSIPACHAGDRGSIPRRGGHTFCRNFKQNKQVWRPKFMQRPCVIEHDKTAKRAAWPRTPVDLYKCPI